MFSDQLFVQLTLPRLSSNPQSFLYRQRPLPLLAATANRPELRALPRASSTVSGDAKDRRRLLKSIDSPSTTRTTTLSPLSLRITALLTSFLYQWRVLAMAVLGIAASANVGTGFSCLSIHNDISFSGFSASLYHDTRLYPWRIPGL